MRALAAWAPTKARFVQASPLRFFILFVWKKRDAVGTVSERTGLAEDVSD